MHNYLICRCIEIKKIASEIPVSVKTGTGSGIGLVKGQAPCFGLEKMQEIASRSQSTNS